MFLVSENNDNVPSEETDTQTLWINFLDGDLQSWEKIFTLFYKDLYGYGLKLSAHQELTKDCIHELFVTLWDRRSHLDKVQSVKAYLLVSLRRKLLKRLKEKRTYHRTLDDQTSFDMQFSPEELIIRDEIQENKRQALYNALDELPARQKEVLYLKYFNGMSYDEIEQILAINYQSIRNHIHRAIKRLRNLLDEHKSETTISLVPLLLAFWM